MRQKLVFRKNPPKKPALWPHYLPRPYRPPENFVYRKRIQGLGALAEVRLACRKSSSRNFLCRVRNVLVCDRRTGKRSNEPCRHLHLKVCLVKYCLVELINGGPSWCSWSRKQIPDYAVPLKLSPESSAIHHLSSFFAKVKSYVLYSSTVYLSPSRLSKSSAPAPQRPIATFCPCQSWREVDTQTGSSRADWCSWCTSCPHDRTSTGR